MRWPMRYCPDCGAELERAASAHHVSCDRCGADHWLNAKPCTGVLIEREGKLLLARRAIEPSKDLWNVIGGFVEADEHPAAAAHREVREETGLTIQLGPLLGMHLDVYGVDSGIRTLNIYYLARAAAGDPRPADDVSELRWFDADALPAHMAFAHEPRLLADWRRERARLWAAADA